MIIGNLTASIPVFLAIATLLDVLRVEEFRVRARHRDRIFLRDRSTSRRRIA